MRHLTRQRGLTLIELMVGLAIGTFLMLTAAPYFSEFTNNSRLREGGNLVYSEALMAQSEASSAMRWCGWRPTALRCR
jgi:type IV fimbrial biogenesis protein FimT